jgi:nucleotide-binding universal stress UspA family protein
LTYRQILVPYDDSEYSKRALDFALAIARAFNSQLHLLNVIEELNVIPRMERQYIISPRTGERESFQQYLKELYQNMKNNAKEMLEEQSKRIGMEGVEVKTKVVLGYTPSKIVEYIREEKIDVVVMGTRLQRDIQNCWTWKCCTKSVRRRPMPSDPSSLRKDGRRYWHIDKIETSNLYFMLILSIFPAEVRK